MSLPLLSALLMPALAGDPCPIPVRLTEYTPEWRERSADLAALASQRSWIGLSYRTRGTTVAVTAVAPGSQAAASGLAPGDRIVRVGEAEITSTQALGTALDALKPGESVSVAYERGGASRSTALQRGQADPVFMAFLDSTSANDCRDSSLFTLSEAQRKAVAAGAFNASRGFQCSSAHTALAPHFERGDVVVVRGGQRILVTAPGVSTRCVAVAELDGERLSTASATAVLEAVLAPYIKDRHDNP